MQHQSAGRELEVLEQPAHEAPHDVLQLDQFDPQHLAPPDLRPLQVVDAYRQQVVEVPDLLRLGELHVVPAHELVEVHAEALVLQPPEHDREQLQASPDVLRDLAHLRKVLDVDVDEVQELADLHSLYDVEVHLVAELAYQVLLPRQAALCGLRENRLCALDALEIRNVKATADLDFAESLQEFLEAARHAADLLDWILLRGIVLQELLLVVARPGELPSYQVVEQNAESERVGFERVNIFLEGLRRHIERASDHVHFFNLRFFVGQVAREAEIPDFPETVFVENIGWLEVAMYY